MTPRKTLLDTEQYLETLGLWNTPQEAAFDRITCIAAGIFRAQCSAITLLHRGKRWYKSYVGPLDPDPYQFFSFCSFAVRGPEPLIVHDALVDPRFAQGDRRPNKMIASYIGVPLISAEGHAIGALCALDPRARSLNEDRVGALVALAKELWHLIEVRRAEYDRVSAGGTV